MHKKFVVNIVARILIFTSLFMLAPLGWAIFDHWHSEETAAFSLTILFGLFVGLACLWGFRIEHVDYEKVNAKDGLAIVGLAWIVLSAFGALPLFLAKVVPTYTDALFEISSGFTTTGATVFPNVEILPRGILFWRSLTHWLGGMGIIVLYLALLPALSQNAYQLFKAEAPGISVERIEPRIKETAKSLWLVYFLLTLLETLFLKLGGMSVFDSLCHTFGTMATGGFSTRNASLAAYDPYAQWVVIVFMFLAVTNFMLHYQVLRGRLSAYWKSEEFRFYLFLILFAVPFFTVLLAEAGRSAHPFRESVFQIVSILTTTGYTSADFDQWPHMLRFGLLMMMFIGGCGGSTGGGMKVVRIFLSIKIAMRSITQAIFPNAVMPIKFNRVPIHDRLVMAVLSYLVIYMLLFFCGGFVFIVIENCDVATGFSAAIAALSNIGPGLGKVGAVQNYAWVSLPGKWILIFLMLAGRLELYSMLVLFLPVTWRK